MKNIVKLCFSAATGLVVFFTGCKVDSTSYYVALRRQSEGNMAEALKERKDITIDSMGIKYNKNTPLFVSVKHPYNAIQKETVEQMVRNLGQSSGVVRVHPHLFRATYATRLAQKGVSVNIIAKSLGHANLNTVERYALLDNVHIEQSIRCVGFN